MSHCIALRQQFCLFEGGSDFCLDEPLSHEEGQSELSSYHVNDHTGIQFDQTSRHPRHGPVKLTNISDCHQM